MRNIGLFRCKESFYFFLICFFLGINCLTTYAEQQKINFAGFAFIGDHRNNDIDFPYSRKIFDLKNPETSQPLLNSALISRISQKAFKDFKLVTDALGDHRNANALSLAIVLDWENINTEVIDGLYKVVINLHGQILIFDFNEKKILAAYPTGIRFNDVLETVPDEVYLTSQFKKIYFENIQGVNVLDEFIKVLDRVDPKEGFCQRTKVSEVVVEETAIKYLPETFKNRPDALKTFIAQQFSTFLSSNMGISILPYSPGEAIGNTMACRFQNGSVFNLSIPKEDIPLRITLRGFKKVKLDENVTGTSWAYGTFIHFLALNPFQEPIVNSRFKNAAVKIVPSQQTTVNDWPAFQESMLSLFDELTQQIVSRDSSWIKSKAEDKDVKKQFKNLEKAIKIS
jgi:hypothetical protein